MMKSGIPVFVVDSVEKAAKFYTEKLMFDIVNLSVDQDSGSILDCAEVRKGKCVIRFSVPLIEELAEFSLIKRCKTRGFGVYIPMKKGLDRYFERCKKKGLEILGRPEVRPWGDRTFEVKDPFGIRLTFAEPVEGFQPAPRRSFLGMAVDGPNDQTLEDMIGWLRGYGILRRSAKKYAKLWLKDVFGDEATKDLR